MANYPTIQIPDERVRVDRFIEVTLILVYKSALEYAFVDYLAVQFAKFFTYSFDPWKYVAGLAVVLLLYFCLPAVLDRPSGFFLELHYLIAIVPITAVYAFADMDTSYYLILTASFALVSLMFQTERKGITLNSRLLGRIMIWGFYAIILVVCLDMVYENGMFTLDALDIFNVYGVRASFKINKYVGYLLRWQRAIIIPFFIVTGLDQKKYGKAVFFIILQFITYLYEGNKVTLFSIPLIILTYYFIKFVRSPKVLYYIFMAGTAILAILPRTIGLIEQCCSLLVRRVLLLPAYLKFLYFDYFSSHEVRGLEGTLWGKMLESNEPYPGGIGYVISSHYYDLPTMNSNTGFMAEGYSRFGFLGIILVFLLFALMLYLLDSFAKKNGNAFAIAISVFSIFMLNDLGIISSMMTGDLFVLICICLFYNKKLVTKENNGSNRYELTKQNGFAGEDQI